MTDKNKQDMRDGLPGHGGTVPDVNGQIAQGDIARNQDTSVKPEPDIVSPEPGRNVPEGQNMKG